MYKQKGFTLLEIMISLLLGIIVVGTTLSIYISSIQGSSDTIKSARLNYDLEAAMALMINDIRRASYWGGAIAGSDATTNPFAAATTDIQIMDYTDASAVVYENGCILYTYDVDDDGVVDNNEYFGFRLDRDSIWMRISGTTTADCTDGAWRQFIDETQVFIPDDNVLVFTTVNYKCLNTRTTLTYNLTCAAAQAGGPVANFVVSAAGITGDKLVELREIVITLTGQQLIDANVSKTLTNRVKVRNNRQFRI